MLLKCIFTLFLLLLLSSQKTQSNKVQGTSRVRWKREIPINSINSTSHSFPLLFYSKDLREARYHPQHWWKSKTSPGNQAQQQRDAAFSGLQVPPLASCYVISSQPWYGNNGRCLPASATKPVYFPHWKPHLFMMKLISFLAQQHTDLVIATASWCLLGRQVCVRRHISSNGNFSDSFIT